MPPRTAMPVSSSSPTTPTCCSTAPRRLRRVARPSRRSAGRSSTGSPAGREQRSPAIPANDPRGPPIRRTLGWRSGPKSGLDRDPRPGSRMSTSALVRSRRAQERVTWASRAQQHARLLAAAALVLSVVVGLGWLLGVDALVTLGRSPVGMKLNTAVAFGLLAAVHLTTAPRTRQVLLGAVLASGATV